MITLTREEAEELLKLLGDADIYPQCEELYKAIETKLSELEPEYKSYQCQQCGEVIGWLGRVMPFHKCAQPESEPVAYMDSKGFLYNRVSHPENYTPLYTAPPQREWQSLTDEEIKTTMENMNWYWCDVEVMRIELCRAIKAKSKEKNG